MMRAILQKHIVLIMLLASLAALTFSFAPLPGASATAQAAATWKGITINWSNVRRGPSTQYPVVKTYAPNTSVTVYASVVGQNVWGSPYWYRISPLNSAPLYIYSGLVVKAQSSSQANPSGSGKVIVVILSKQWLYAYENGKQVFNTPITSGRPSLPTPTGTFHVLRKLHPTTFYSPWPPGSPYYYPPTFINYALEFDWDGYFLHDAWWHGVFGPATNGWHYDPVAGWTWGSHGCVEMSVKAAAWLYNWAPVGTTVIIRAS
ncbi:L,D-transpeptidase [Thermogemmatispora sp.]|uniref:L,D-transpeptidase n=2 Tax=Thermogemmatispora sp. TaxID=1968838 RepID=UPI002ACBE19F|nr:L,D-transpeptidase family protein [Thermogemmatispora sp.]